MVRAIEMKIWNEDILIKLKNKLYFGEWLKLFQSNVFFHQRLTTFSFFFQFFNPVLRNNKISKHTETRVRVRISTYLWTKTQHILYTFI